MFNFVALQCIEVTHLLSVFTSGLYHLRAEALSGNPQSLALNIYQVESDANIPMFCHHLLAPPTFEPQLHAGLFAKDRGDRPWLQISRLA